MTDANKSIINGLDSALRSVKKGKLITFEQFEELINIPKELSITELMLYKSLISGVCNNTLYSMCDAHNLTQRSILSRMLLEDYVSARSGSSFWVVKCVTDRVGLVNMGAPVDTGILERPNNLSSEMLMLFNSIGATQTLQLYLAFAYHQHKL